mgnify:CR=1 FL=1
MPATDRADAGRKGVFCEPSAQDHRGRRRIYHPSMMPSTAGSRMRTPPKKRRMPASGMRRRDGQKDQGEDTDNQMQDKG